MTVTKACPTFWEEVTAKIDITNQSSNLWLDDELGRVEFIEFLRDSMGANAPDDTGLNVMADDPLTVATECATQKIQLMQTLVVDMPRNIMGSMQLVAQTFGAMLGEGYSGDDDDIFDLGDAIGVPPGTLLSYSGETLPRGRFLWAFGQEVSREDYKKLFDAIGITYGVGDGSTTFNLPDTRNLVVRGTDVDEEVGQVAGTDSVVVSKANLPSITLTSNSTGSHAHGINAGGNHTHSMGAAGNHRHKHHDRRANGYRGVKGGGAIHDSESYTDYAGNHAHKINAAGNHTHTMKTAGTHNHTVPLGGSNQPIDTTPKHLKTKFIIAY